MVSCTCINSQHWEMNKNDKRILFILLIGRKMIFNLHIVIALIGLVLCTNAAELFRDHAPRSKNRHNRVRLTVDETETHERLGRAKQCGFPGVGSVSDFMFKNKLQTELNLSTKDLASNFSTTMSSIDRLSFDFSNGLEENTDKIHPRRKRQVSSQNVSLIESHRVAMIQPTIVGGFDALPNQICWQAKVTISLSMGTASCGGTIIGSKTIMTAAHCTLNPFVTSHKEQFKPEMMTVQIGAMTRKFTQFNPSQDKTGCAENFQVSRVETHPNYDQEIGNNDIALLILSRPINFNTHPCACRICLRDEEPAVGDICVVSGTGDESSGGEANRPSIPLKWVRLQILDPTSPGVCAVSTSSDGRQTDVSKFVCAGNVIGEDSCQGDSGGPLVCVDQSTQSFYSAGTVSFGDGCGTGVGGQYTKTKSYLDWIRLFGLTDVNI